MSDGTIPTPGASVGAEVVLENTGDIVTAAEAAVVEVRVTNPPAVPYRTGSYLIYDEGAARITSGARLGWQSIHRGIGNSCGSGFEKLGGVLRGHGLTRRMTVRIHLEAGQRRARRASPCLIRVA